MERGETEATKEEVADVTPAYRFHLHSCHGPEARITDRGNKMKLDFPTTLRNKIRKPHPRGRIFRLVLNKILRETRLRHEMKGVAFHDKFLRELLANCWRRHSSQTQSGLPAPERQSGLPYLPLAESYGLGETCLGQVSGADKIRPVS